MNWRRAAALGVATGLPILIFVLLAAMYVSVGALETDEGFYGIAAKLAASGLVPYRDFAFNQAHVFPYLHGAILSAVGFGLWQHRAVCAGYGLLSVALVGVGALRRGRAFASGLAALAVATSAHHVYRVSLGQSFGAAGLFLAAEGAALLWMRPGRARAWIVGVSGALAVGCKLTVAPAVGLLWAWQLATDRRVSSLAAPAVAVLAAFAPVVLAAPEAWWFWNVGYHLGMQAIDFRTREAYLDHLLLAPAVVALMAAALAVAIRRGRERPDAVAVLAAAALGWAIQLPLRSTQGEYGTLFVPLGALGAAELLSILKSRWRWSLALALPLVLALPLALARPLPPLDPKLRENLGAAAALLRQRVPLDRPLVTPLPVVALESGHPVLPGLEQGPFCITTEMPPDRARRLHVQTPDSLIDALQSGAAGAVVLTSQPSTWDFYWSVPSLAPVPEADRARLFAAIAAARFRPSLHNAELTVLLPGEAAAEPWWHPAAAAH